MYQKNLTLMQKVVFFYKGLYRDFLICYKINNKSKLKGKNTAHKEKYLFNTAPGL